MTLDFDKKPLKAYQLYRAFFCKDSLFSLYDEKIKLSKAVGKDGVRRGMFEDKLKTEIPLILKNVENREYTFTAYKEKLISKGAYKVPRQISIPTFRDRLTLRALCELLAEVFKDCVTRPPHEYIKKIKEISRNYDDTYCFLRMDIQEYYPSINHDILVTRLRARIRKPQLITLIINAIETPTGKKNTLNNLSNVGVPQGLSISNILSSIYLHNIDKKYETRTHYFRYVDDLLVICKKNEALDIYRRICKDLRLIGLEAHDLGDAGKTKISSMSEGVEYLGFHISNKSVCVRHSSYRRMFTNLLTVFTSYKYSKNKERLIFRLNLKISGCIFDGKRRGWMFFFAQTDDKSQLKYLDKFVSEQIIKLNVPIQTNQLKTFIKSYHEIRYKGENSTYIENFGNYSLEQKIKLICILTDREKSEVEIWSIETIEEVFKKCTFKEVIQLEKDLIEGFS